MGRVAVSEMIRQRLARDGRDSSTPSLVLAVLAVLEPEQSSGEQSARAAREETFFPTLLPGDRAQNDLLRGASRHDQVAIGQVGNLSGSSVFS